MTKIFLDRFNIKSGVLNTNLPQSNQNSVHNSFKLSVFTYLITYNIPLLRSYGNVTSIILIDPPEKQGTYTNLITHLSYGQGTLLTFVTEDETTAFLQTMSKYTFAPLPINNEVVDNFQYRCDDVYRSIRRKQIQLEKEKEFSRALLKSKKMKEYFQANANEKEMLEKKAYSTQFPIWKFKDLHKVPSYLVPQSSLLTNNIEKALQKENLQEKSMETQVDPFYYETPLIVDADKLEPTSGRKRWMIRHRKGNKKKKLEN